jgi:hypothetical protein
MLPNCYAIVNVTKLKAFVTLHCIKRLCNVQVTEFEAMER